MITLDAQVNRKLVIPFGPAHLEISNPIQIEDRREATSDSTPDEPAHH